MFSRICRISDASFYDSARVGELVSRLTADTTQLKTAFGASASVVLRNLFMFIGAIALMMADQPEAVGARARRHSADRLPADLLRPHGAQALAPRAGHAGGRIRLRRRESRRGAHDAGLRRRGSTTRRFARAVEEAYDAARASPRDARSILTSVAILMASASVIGVLWYGAHDVLVGRMTSGTLSQFVLYAVLGASSLGELSQVWSKSPPPVPPAVSANCWPCSRRSSRPAPVVLPKPSRRDRLRPRRLFLSPRRRSPASSTTCRSGSRPANASPSSDPPARQIDAVPVADAFLRSAAGRVTLDGVDIKDGRSAGIAAAHRPVPQEPVIFGATIAENIAYGRPDATRAEIESAEGAAAAGFIAELDKGWRCADRRTRRDAVGGQRQRLSSRAPS